MGIIDLIVKKQTYGFLLSINHIIGNVSDVADIGCGRRPYAKAFSDKRYVCLDISELVRPDIVASATNLPFKNNAFDMIILTEVLEHLPEPEEALKEIRRVLRAGGFLVVTVPQYMYLHEIPHDYYRFTYYGISTC